MFHTKHHPSSNIDRVLYDMIRREIGLPSIPSFYLEKIETNKCTLCDYPISDGETKEANGIECGNVHKVCIDSIRGNFSNYSTVPAHTRKGSIQTGSGSAGRGRTQSRRGII